MNDIIINCNKIENLVVSETLSSNDEMLLSVSFSARNIQTNKLENSFFVIGAFNPSIEKEEKEKIINDTAIWLKQIYVEQRNYTDEELLNMRNTISKTVLLTREGYDFLLNKNNKVDKIGNVLTRTIVTNPSDSFMKFDLSAYSYQLQGKKPFERVEFYDYYYFLSPLEIKSLDSKYIESYVRDPKNKDRILLSIQLNFEKIYLKNVSTLINEGKDITSYLMAYLDATISKSDPIYKDILEKVGKNLNINNEVQSRRKSPVISETEFKEKKRRDREKKERDLKSLLSSLEKTDDNYRSQRRK